MLHVFVHINQGYLPIRKVQNYTYYTVHVQRAQCGTIQIQGEKNVRLDLFEFGSLYIFCYFCNCSSFFFLSKDT